MRAKRERRALPRELRTPRGCNRAAGPEAREGRGEYQQRAALPRYDKPTIIIAINNAPVAQLDRVPGFEPGGREFESLRARDFLIINSSGHNFSTPALGKIPLLM